MAFSDMVIDDLCGEFETARPTLDADGKTVFRLDGGLCCGVRRLPGEDRRCVVWTVAADPVAGEREAETEKRYADFLRLFFARTGACPTATACRDDDGALTLYTLLDQDAAGDWRDAVAALLDEADLLRRDRPGAGAPATGFPFPGFPGFPGSGR